MPRLFQLLACSALLSVSSTNLVDQTDGARHPVGAEPISLIVRSDDGGMSHSVNMALERLVASGIPVSVSVMFPTPWYQETVEMPTRHPDVSGGRLSPPGVRDTDGGLPAVSRNRQGELDAVTSNRFRDAVRGRNVELITYRQLIEMQGLKSMRRPGEG